MTEVMEVRDALDDVLAAHGAVDWDDPHAARALARAIFDEVTARDDLLPSLVESTSLDVDGAGESYPSMDKMVLWQSADREVRLRLHVFSPGYFDRPHNHRWNFVSRILAGSYVHSLYGFEADVLGDVSAGRQPRAVYAGLVPTGTEYFLHHSVVHSLRTDAVTVSLVLRGPSVKDGYFTLERSETPVDPAERVTWSSGAERETAEQRATKAMSDEGRARVARVLREVVRP